MKTEKQKRKHLNMNVKLQNINQTYATSDKQLKVYPAKFGRASAGMIKMKNMNKRIKKHEKKKIEK